MKESLLQNATEVRLAGGFEAINVQFVFNNPQLTTAAFNELLEIAKHRELVITIVACTPEDEIREEPPGSVKGVVVHKTIKLPGMSGEAHARQGFVRIKK